MVSKKIDIAVHFCQKIIPSTSSSSLVINMSFAADLIGDALTGLLRNPVAVEARQVVHSCRKRKCPSSSTETKEAASSSSTETKEAASSSSSSSAAEATAFLPPSKKVRVVTFQVTPEECEENEKLKQANAVRKKTAAQMNTTWDAIEDTASEIANELTTVYGSDFQHQLRRIISNLQRSEELRSKIFSGDMSACDMARATPQQLCPPPVGTRFCEADGVYGFHD